MARALRPDPKREALRAQGVLNPHPEAVHDPLFGEHPFFDARDLLQVKYEMLRRVEVDKASITQAAAAFGVSRPTFYQAQAAFAREGLTGLLPKKRGPRHAHKLDEAVLGFLEQARAEDGALRPGVLAERLREHFGLEVHPRSIERALRRREKKRR
jgi:transposase